ncbi:MAG: hypothetical protein VZR53_12535 [Prevotella sp.]|nr:hypothetical protein [Prevotella sp.]
MSKKHKKKWLAQFLHTPSNINSLSPEELGNLEKFATAFTIASKGNMNALVPLTEINKLMKL